MLTNQCEVLTVLKVFPIDESFVLICTVGLPYSGKTTQALDIAQALSAPIVSPDAIRVALHGQRYVGQAERMVWAMAHNMVDALFMAGHKFVILDATCNTRKRRDDWRRFKQYSTWFYLVDTDAAECLRRADEAGGEHIKEVIERMNEQHEPLEEDETEYTLNSVLGRPTIELPMWRQEQWAQTHSP